MTRPTIIAPYLFDEEIQKLKEACLFLDADLLFERDEHRIGPDMMYQKLWNKAKPSDVIILHSDMSFVDGADYWLSRLMNFVELYPEAGILGCKLLYPVKNPDTGNYLVQSAGGCFTSDGRPDHFGSGYDMSSKQTWKEVVEDTGQFNCVREVAWTTFGGLYIRREVLDQVGSFDPGYEWSYNRDVDYCLAARHLGWKIYQVPVPLWHFESKDVKRIRTRENVEAEKRNLERLKGKWAHTDLYKTVDRVVDAN